MDSKFFLFTVHVTVDNTTFDVTGYKDAHGMPDFIYVHNGYLLIYLNNFSASQCPPWAGQDYHRGWHGYEGHNYHVWFEGERVAEAHYGGSATCQHRATCSACGREYGIYPGHQSNNVWVKTPATCTTDGEQHTNCKWCGKIMNYKPLKAPGHSDNGSWVWNTAGGPTCTNGSYKHTNCSRCGTALNTTWVGPYGHNSASAVGYQYATNNGIANGYRYKECGRNNSGTVCHHVLESAYLVSTSKGTGVASVTGSYYASSGANVSLSATPATGYQISGWTEIHG